MSKIIIEASSRAELATILADFGFVPSVVGASQLIASAMPAIVVDADEEDASPVNTAAPNVDTRGFPHDDRLHSKNKTINDDGTWRYKKGLKDDVKAAVESELQSRGFGVVQQQQPVQQMPTQTQPLQMQQQPTMQIQQQPAQIQQPVQMPVQTQPLQMQQQPMVQQQPVQQVVQPVQQPVQQQPAQVQQSVGIDFHGFMQAMSRGMNAEYNGAKIIDPNYLAALAQLLGVSAITDLAARPDLIPQAVAQVQADNRWIAG